MQNSDLSTLRLQNQHLSGELFGKPEEVVSWLGAVQAQDFPAAKWGLGLRTKNATDELVEKAYNEGKILRTHVMRPTWHFVMPEDIRWLQKLTGPNVSRLLFSYSRKLGLDEEVFRKSSQTIAKVLKNGQQLTRSELKLVLEKVGITTDVQQLAHLVMQAELEALICSGPKIGKQLTYQLLEEAIAPAEELTRDEALARLTLKYFQSHGPAQLRDFIWWSGLSKKDSLEGLELVKSKLVQEVIDEKTYWFSPDLKLRKEIGPRAYLLSIYDEYTIAYNDRSALGDGRYFERLIQMGNALTSVILLDGQIVGTWKRAIVKSNVEVKLSPFRDLEENEQEAVNAAARRFGKFLNLEVLVR